MAVVRERSVCIELAMEGERLCKSGDCRAAVQYFEEAVSQGTDDLKALSAIYSQLGNAYFYLQEYHKAMDYHNHDRTLARTTEDKIGEAKASGNLANTLKMLGRFDEAVVCCCRHLEISRELNDRVGEARALYNLGNIYHMRGKRELSLRAVEKPPQCPEGAIGLMRKAITYYEDNLAIVQDVGDRAAQGRAYGSLGNTNYLLGNYRDAIKYHTERLAIAREFGDKSGERRAYSNLGNAHVLLGEYESAADFYERMANVAKQLKDRAMEAQAYYSLGNTFTLLRDYEEAIEYHLKHLAIALEVNDRVGECKACWSLSNAHISLGNLEQALEFTKKQLLISAEVGDENGRITAENHLQELLCAMTRDKGRKDNGDERLNRRIRRTSMENIELLKLTPEQAKGMEAAKSRKARSKSKKQSSASQSLFRNTRSKSMNGEADDRRGQKPTSISHEMPEDDTFFNLITQLQGRRMDDQRCTMDDGLPDFLQQNVQRPEENGAVGEDAVMENDADQNQEQISNMINMLANSQAKRMNEQRVSLSELPGFRTSEDGSVAVPAAALRSRSENGSVSSQIRDSLDDNFFNSLMRCQSTRLNDQRSAPPIFDPPVFSPTIPDEDFFALIVRMQSSRIEDQRCVFSPDSPPISPVDSPPQDDETP